MLIDINAYIGHWPFRRLQHNTCASRLQQMEQYGVDLSVVSNLNGIFYKNVQSANEELVEELTSNKRFRQKFLPFAVLNPMYSGWQEDLDICRDKFGMRGIRLYPLYHRYELLHPSCLDLVKRARDKGMVISLSLRMVDKRVSSWLDINEEWSLQDILPLIEAVPDAQYLIVNVAGGTNLTNEEAQTLKKASVILDTSGRSISNLPQLLQRYGKEKFAFGTHAPILDYRTGLLRIEVMKEEEASQATKNLLRSGNAQHFLNI